MLGWVVYWLGLTGATLGPGLVALWRATREGAHGSASGGFSSDTGIGITIKEGSRLAWEANWSVGALAFWLAVPPLLLWLGWVWRKKVAMQAITRRSAAELAAGPLADGELSGRVRERAGLEQNR